jgi:di/tricarboxylate transporter
MLLVAAALSIAASLLVVWFADLGFGDAEYKGQQPAQRCLAVLVLVAALWSTEIIPAHVTALLVPLLTVLFRVVCVPRHVLDRAERDVLLVPARFCNSTDPGPGQPMPPDQTAVVSVGAFFNPLILLFLAGKHPILSYRQDV